MITQSYIAIHIKGDKITHQRRTLVATDKKTAINEIASWNKQIQPQNHFTIYAITEVKPLPYYNHPADRLYMISPNVFILYRKQQPTFKPFNGSLITHIERLPSIPCNRTQLAVH